MSSRSHEYDAFISHATEDKDSFVRPLVAELTSGGLSVWFDELSLRPGDGLIQSIEKGLSRCRFGVVVLSPAFFSKRWPRAELDALTNRELATGESILIPIWLDVGADQVREYSALLADRYAIIGNRGVGYAASAVQRRILPGGSPIAIARELLNERGLGTPPPSDPWWLGVVESQTEPDYVDIHSGLLRWGFPLPADEANAESKGRRLEQTVLRDAWMAEADRRAICQTTDPAVVHEFLEEMPGLLETALEYPRYLATYVPQLVIPGFGGRFEPLFDDWLACELQRGRASLDVIGWHAPVYDAQDAARLACDFVQGPLMGPSVMFWNSHLDYFFWALSDQSLWMPKHARETLIRGICDWAVWATGSARDDRDARVDLLELLQDTTRPALRDAVRRPLMALASASREALDLSEAPAELVERLLATGAVEAYDRERRRVEYQGDA